MPGYGTQLEFGASDDCLEMRSRPDLETVPFIGNLSNPTTAATSCAVEVRRRDVGPQKYGSGVPSFNGTLVEKPSGLLNGKIDRKKLAATCYGNLNLTGNDPHLGWMPTADSILFLRSEYLGSRQSDPPARYFP